MRRRSSFRWALALAWPLASLGPSTANASGEAATDSDKRQEAEQEERTLVRQGSERFLRHDYEGARVALRRAYELNPRADTVVQLGISELQSGHPVEAAQHLREFLTHTEEPASKLEPVRTKWLPRAEAATTRLEVFAPPGAQVLIDGAAPAHPAPSTPGELSAGGPNVSVVISAGEHDVSARQGAFVEEQHVTAQGGQLLELHFQRVPDAPPSPPPIDPSSHERESPASGKEARSRARRITIIALGSAALAATGVAIGISIAFEGNASDARGLRALINSPTNSGCRTPTEPCTMLSQVDDAEERNGALATWFYVAGGAAAALAAASWLLWPQAKDSTLHPSPMVGAGRAGIALQGAW